MSEIELDCFGEVCPVPIIRIQNTLETLKKGDTIKVISDHSCVVQSILTNSGLRKSGLKIEHEEVINGVWEILITSLDD